VKGRGGGDRAGDGDECDPRSAGDQQRKVRDGARYRERRDLLRERADERVAWLAGEIKTRRGRDRGDHRDEHAWNPRDPSPERQNQDETEYADGDGRTDSLAMRSTRTA
jgi:hypothetical protein